MAKIKYDYFDAKVGQKYIVPCAIYIKNAKEIVVPLIGNFHTDKDFKENREHIHVDMRFYKQEFPREPVKNKVFIILVALNYN
jgi:hypothetical protein